MFLFKNQKSFLIIILKKHHSWYESVVSLLQQKLCLGLVLDKGLLFWWYKCKLTRRVNTENEVKTSLQRPIASERGKIIISFQIVHSNPNSKGNEVRCLWTFFLNLFIHFIFKYFFFLFHVIILIIIML